MSPPSVTVILPAFNEAGTIRDTISRTAAYFQARGRAYEIIVAADGDDGTRELVTEIAARDPALKVIGESSRRGKGRGIREAMALASGDIIGYADADYKVPIEEFDKIEPWLSQGYDLVIGSRALERSSIERKQPLHRQLGSWGFRGFMRAVVGLWHISDSQCGFKFFRRHVAVQLFRCQQIDGYMFDVEILVLAQLYGYRLKEVPIRWRDDGDSRLQLLAGNLQNVRDILRIRFSRSEYRRRIAAMAQGEVRVRGEAR